jgi:hypothetical protein
MTNADGSHVTVKCDKNFEVTAVQTERGTGGPGGGMGHRRPGEPLRPPAEQTADRPPAADPAMNLWTTAQRLPAAPPFARSRCCHARRNRRRLVAGTL